MKKEELILLILILLLPLATAVTGEVITGEASQNPTNVSVFVLPGPPVIYIYSPESTTYYDTNVLLNYTIKNEINSSWYNIDNGNNNSLSNFTNNTLTFTTSLGTHTLYLYANNSNGTTMSQVTFTVAQQTSSSSGSSGGSSGGGSLIYSFDIDRELIEVSMLQGESKSQTITITNTGTAKLNMKINPLNTNLVELPTSSIELNPNEEKQVEIQFLANTEPGIYPGKIQITAGAILKSLDYILEIKEPDSIFDISLKIPEKYKETNPGKNIQFSIDLTKIGVEEPTEADLILYLTDFDKNIISERITEPLSISKDLSITRGFDLPVDIKKGTYLAVAEIYYNNLTASSYDTFDVVEKQGFPFPWWLLLILAIVIALIVFLTLHLFAFKKHYEVPKLGSLKRR
jgi:hypothetical protein